MEQIDLLNLAYQLTCFLLVACVLGAAWIIFDMTEKKILTILCRRHYQQYERCLICDHNEAIKHIPGYTGDRNEHRIECWKNGEPNDA